jgi:HD-like signal output (HDOD) protein
MDIEKTEADLCGFNSTQITVLLLENWNLDVGLIEAIQFINTPQDAPDVYKRSSQVQNIIRTICNLTNPLADVFVKEGLKKAEEFGFDKQPLENTIIKVQKLLEEKNS